METGAKQVEQELRDIGVIGTPSLTEIRKSVPPSPLPDQDRALLVQICQRARQKISFVEKELADLKALVSGVEDLISVSNSTPSSSKESQEPVNGTSVQEEPEVRAGGPPRSGEDH